MLSASAELPTWAEATEAFLASLAGRAPKTRATYASGLRRFVEFLHERGLAPDALAACAVQLATVE